MGRTAVREEEGICPTFRFNAWTNTTLTNVVGSFIEFERNSYNYGGRRSKCLEP